MANKPPMNWAGKNRSSELGEIPAGESVKTRPSDTAGFANDVEAVKKYAESIQSAIKDARKVTLNFRQAAIAINTSPRLAITSDRKIFGPDLSISEIAKISLSKSK